MWTLHACAYVCISTLEDVPAESHGSDGRHGARLANLVGLLNVRLLHILLASIRRQWTLHPSIVLNRWNAFLIPASRNGLGLVTSPLPRDLVVQRMTVLRFGMTWLSRLVL